jgi:bacterioferritin-associated ferredoxin
MYVCVCHAVTEDDVRRYADAGVCSAKELRAACGMRPGCGQCVLKMRSLLGADQVGADQVGADQADNRTLVGVSEAFAA